MTAPSSEPGGERISTPPDPPAKSSVRRLALPLLVAAGLLLLMVFGEAPSETTITLGLDTAAPLEALAADCVDDEGSSTSARWHFVDGHPPELEFRTLTSGTQVRCEFDFRQHGRRRSVVRNVELRSEHVRVLLGREIEKLNADD